MKRQATFVFLVLVTFVSLGAGHGASGLGLSEPDRQDLARWMESHPGYRLATENDCNCRDDIDELRRGSGGAWKPQPTYQPYYAQGDFDGNGLLDFAVVVRDEAQGGASQILVFLRRSEGHDTQVASKPIDRGDLRGFGLFVGTPAGKRTKLLAGAFGSEGYEVEIPVAPR